MIEDVESSLESSASIMVEYEKLLKYGKYI